MPWQNRGSGDAVVPLLRTAFRRQMLLLARRRGSVAEIRPSQSARNRNPAPVPGTVTEAKGNHASFAVNKQESAILPFPCIPQVGRPILYRPRDLFHSAVAADDTFPKRSFLHKQLVWFSANQEMFG